MATTLINLNKLSTVPNSTQIELKIAFKLRTASG